MNNQKPINVLSLFDGISCGQVALQRAGIKVNKYFASEIDTHAIKVARNNFPNTIQLYDIMRISCSPTRRGNSDLIMSAHWTCIIQDIHLLIGGSPCQGFSFAGKQLNFEDPRSKLFFEYVRILKEIRVHNPNILFLLENVKMKKEYQDVISEQLGVQPIEINSALVSAQNRKRLYWTNIPNVTQPEDKGVLLKDVLEDGFMPINERNKDQTLLSSLYKENVKSMQKRGKEGLYVSVLIPVIKNKGKIIEEGDKSHCLDANYFKGPDNHGQRTFLIKEEDIRTKSKTVRTSGLKSYDRHEWDSVDINHFRKLTPLECERLQTLPDNYTAGISNTQRYKAIGNGWTVDVIAHIFKHIKF